MMRRYAPGDGINERLLAAVSSGNIEQITTLLAQNADPTYQDFGENTALHVAVEMENLKAVQAILNAPNFSTACLAIKNGDGWTPLFSAIVDVFSEVAIAIVKSRHCTTEILAIECDDDSTALTEAAHRNCYVVAQAIFDSPHCTPDIVNRPDRPHRMPILEAFFEGHEEVVLVILRSRHYVPEFRAVAGNNTWEVFQRALNGYCAVIKFMFQSPYFRTEFLSMWDSDGFTPLTHTVREAYLEVAKLILQSSHARADILSIQNKAGPLRNSSREGWTPLHAAASVYGGNTEAVRMILCTPYSDIKLLTIEDSEGLTPEGRAAAENHANIEAMFQSFRETATMLSGAPADVEVVDLETHLKTAADNGWWHLTYPHLEWVSLVPKRIETLIEYTVRYGQVGIFEKIWDMISLKYSVLAKKLQQTLLDTVLQTDHNRLLLHVLDMPGPFTTTDPNALLTRLQKAFTSSTSILLAWIQKGALSALPPAEVQEGGHTETPSTELAHEVLEHHIQLIVAKHSHRQAADMEAGGGGGGGGGGEAPII